MNVWFIIMFNNIMHGGATAENTPFHTSSLPPFLPSSFLPHWEDIWSPTRPARCSPPCTLAILSAPVSPCRDPLRHRAWDSIDPSLTLVEPEISSKKRHPMWSSEAQGYQSQAFYRRTRSSSARNASVHSTCQWYERFELHGQRSQSNIYKCATWVTRMFGFVRMDHHHVNAWSFKLMASLVLA